jgi:hypothetical protein
MLMYAILGAPIIIAAGANEQNTAVRPVVVLKILSRFLVSRFLVFFSERQARRFIKTGSGRSRAERSARP